MVVLTIKETVHHRGVLQLDWLVSGQDGPEKATMNDIVGEKSEEATKNSAVPETKPDEHKIEKDRN